jgi:dedicator of cytokinesis protein 1
MFLYRLLDLDMVVRDDQGNILNPDITSTIQLHWQHELATERIRKATVSFRIWNVKF